MDVLYMFTDPSMPEGNELLIRRHYDAVYSDNTQDRRSLAACMKELRPGDTLHVMSEVHLAKDTAGCVEVLKRLARKGISVRLGRNGAVLPCQTSPFLALGTEAVKAFKAFRNAFVQRRARQGTRRAMQKGVRVGRPVQPLPEGFAEAARSWLAGEVTALQASAKIGMPFSTFVKKAHLLQEEAQA